MQNDLLKRALEALSNIPMESLTIDDMELIVELEEFLTTGEE